MGKGKQGHDARCAEMFLRFLGKGRKPRTLSRREWDRFIADRRAGRIAPKGTPADVDGKRRIVGERVIAYDLKWLVAVLNWATMAGDGKGGTLLDRNPLKGLTVPKEESPRRPMISADAYAALRKVAPQVHRQFGLFLLLAHETGHRGASIRQCRRTPKFPQS